MDIQGYNKSALTNIQTNLNGNILNTPYGSLYQEAVSTGNVYMVANQAGITTQAGLSATTPALTLYNPVGSGVKGVLVYAGCINTVAFAAASVIWLGANTNLSAAAVTGTLTTAHRNANLGSASGNKIQSLLAATLPAAPVAVSTLGVGLTGAITTTPQISTLARYYDGIITIDEGAALSFQTSTASGTNGFFGEFIWFEIAKQ